jgi:hypothetical protein
VNLRNLPVLVILLASGMTGWSCGKGGDTVPAGTGGADAGVNTQGGASAGGNVDAGCDPASVIPYCFDNMYIQQCTELSLQECVIQLPTPLNVDGMSVYVNCAPVPRLSADGGDSGWTYDWQSNNLVLSDDVCATAKAQGTARVDVTYTTHFPLGTFDYIMIVHFENADAGADGG